MRDGAGKDGRYIKFLPSRDDISILCLFAIWLLGEGRVCVCLNTLIASCFGIWRRRASFKARKV